jgi:hypothetical protein
MHTSIAGIIRNPGGDLESLPLVQCLRPVRAQRDSKWNTGRRTTAATSHIASHTHQQSQGHESEGAVFPHNASSDLTRISPGIVARIEWVAPLPSAGEQRRKSAYSFLSGSKKVPHAYVPCSVPSLYGSWCTNVFVWFLLLLSLIEFAGKPAMAQLDTGTITGTITDPTGAVVYGAKVKVTNEGTRITTSTTSTSTGTYSLHELRPGTYSLEAEAPGFQKFVAKGVEVHVQQTITIDIQLANGEVYQQVTVTAVAPLLQSESAAVGQTITSQTVTNLPLQTRNWASLAQLSAGVTTAPVHAMSSDAGSTSSPFFSVNGVSVWQNDFRLNGINDNTEFFGGNAAGTNAAIIPPPDAIQEFKLQSGNFNAEFGHSTGAVINAATKSGTNQIHGDVWEYLRNDVFNANLFFNSATHAPTPEYRQNLFGFTLGGPVYIPKVYNGKSKTFFFVDYQGGRYITSSTATSTVPTRGMISSQFTNLQDLIAFNSGTSRDALGRTFRLGTIFDPATTRQVAAGAIDPVSGLVNNSGSAIYVRDPFYTGSLRGMTDFTGATAQLNMIPQQRLDPNAVKLLGIYPAPNRPGFANNFVNVAKQSQDTDSYDIRIDENINANNVVFGVFDRSLISRVSPSPLPGVAVGQVGGADLSFPAYAFAVGYSHIFAPTLSNDMHFGILHADNLQRSFYGNTFGIPVQYGITGIPQVANNGGLPPITIRGLTAIGVGTYNPTLAYVRSVEGSENVTKVFRNHSFKAGIQIDDLEGDVSQPPAGRGTLNFNGQYSDIPNSNNNLNGIADLLLIPIASTVGGIDGVGGMSSFSGSNIAFTDYHRWYLGAYFQDDWKVSSSLTVNLGLRWDYFTPYAEINGRQANFIAAGGNGSTGTYFISRKGCQVPRSASFDALLTSNHIALDCVSGLAIGDAQKTNFAPRLGFAYRAKTKLVFRGGYGIVYGALANVGYGGTLGTNYPFVYTSTFPSADSQHPILLSNGETATMENAFTTINLGDPTIISGEGLNLYGRQYNFQTPYVQVFNLTVQEQVSNHDSMQIAYVGTVGRHLDNLGYHNSPIVILPPGANAQNYVPFPDFARNSIYETTNGTSSYNSLQATYERQLSSGLSLLANYTYSRCLSNQFAIVTQTQGYRGEWLPGFGINADYGLCDTDASNVVHLSGTYDLPFGRGRAFLSNSNRALNTIISGWVINFIYTYQSGQPITVGCPVATTADFGCFAFKVPGENPYAGPHNYKQWLNPNAFAQPPVATQIGQTDFAVLGGAPQQVRGPGFSNLDLSVLKNVGLGEVFRMQFRAEAFNATNTPQFGQPGNLDTFNNPKGGFSAITTMRGDPRTLQFAIKLLF